MIYVLYAPGRTKCSRLDLSVRVVCSLFSSYGLKYVSYASQHTECKCANMQRNANTPCSAQDQLYSLQSSLCYINTAFLSLPFLTLLDLVLLCATFLLPVGTRPSAQKKHANTSCKNVSRVMRLRLSCGRGRFVKSEDVSDHQGILKYTLLIPLLTLS